MQKETEDAKEFEWNVPGADSEEAVDGAVSQDALKERQELREFGSQKNNPLIAPQERLPSTLFDLRNVLQVSCCFRTDEKNKKSWPAQLLHAPFLVLCVNSIGQGGLSTCVFMS